MLAPVSLLTMRSIGGEEERAALAQRREQFSQQAVVAGFGERRMELCVERDEAAELA